MNIFKRTQMLIGSDGLEKLQNSHVAVFGIGGVGSFTVEALVRGGIGTLTIIDFDVIDETNINRQIIALQSTIGKAKVDVMKERIHDINPSCIVVSQKDLYNADTSPKLISKDFDYVVDAIDMVSSKLHLVEQCKALNIPIICSMGTGNKLDPTQFEISDISKTSVCPLAKVMRKELKKREIYKLKVLYSRELPMKPHNIDTDINGDEKAFQRRGTPGSISFVPSVAGLIIAGEVIKDLLKTS